MKRPQPDLGATQLQAFLQESGSIRKLVKLWGTTTVNGVEVLHRRQYYYPSSKRSEKFKSLFQHIGAYEGVTNSDYKGIDKAWMYFNKNNGTIPPSNTKGFVADNLNSLWWDPTDGTQPEGLTLTTSLVIEALIDNSKEPEVRTTSLLDPSWDKSTLISAVEDNYDDLWDTCLISHQGVGVINKGTTVEPLTNYTVPDEDDLSPNDPWLSVLTRNALRSHGPDCTIKDVSVGYGKIESGEGEYQKSYNTYVVTLEIPYTVVSEGSLFVESINYDLTDDYTTKFGGKLELPNGYHTKRVITSMDSSDIEDDPSVVTRSYRLWEDEAAEQNALFASMWYRYGGKWYLRADALRNPRSFGLRFKDVNAYVWPLIDSDYKKESVPWWKKFVAAVLFVVVVVLSAGTATPGAVALAGAVLTGALALTLLSATAALTGEYGWASAFASVNGDIEPLVFIATFITFTSFLNSVAEEATKGAAKQLGKDVADVTIGETASYMVESYVGGAVDNVVKGATDLFSGTISNASLQFAEKLGELMLTPEKNKLKDINSSNKDLKAEYEDLMKELNQESDVLKGFTRIYSKPATADWSMYAATFDQPYERGGGVLALGNIQRTTKQATRKADYSDPAFAGIIGL